MVQQELPRTSTHGGKRKKAGRKKSGRKVGVPHRSRFVHPKQPLHVTLRIAKGVRNLRADRPYKVIARAMVAGCNRFGFRLVHHIVEGNHIHMICEADDARALGRGMKGLGVRIARAVNALTGDKGSVIGDRYHARTLRTPSEVRNALNYVLKNTAHHEKQLGRRGITVGYDNFSSARWFDGWTTNPPVPDEPRPGVEPTVWLLKVGWKRRGLLRAF